MDTQNQERFLETIFREEGFSLSGEQLTAFLRYYELLTEKNQVMNLTAITEFPEVSVKHFLDSAMLLRHLDAPGKLVDVGTGAGFPGIPLKILAPETEVLLLDALQKRLGFLDEVIRELKLSGIRTLHARAEDAADARKNGVKQSAPPVALREQFDTAVSRAVASLPVLLEYNLPFVKPGGVFAAYKSGNPEDEIRASGRALRILGGEIEKIEKFSLPENAGERSILLIRKTKETPARYPRKSGTPGKEPL